MRRLTLAASTMLAVAVPGVASAQTLSRTETQDYGMSYAHVVHVFGARAAGCKLIGPNPTCHGRVTAARVRASTGVLHRMFAPPPAPVVTHSAPATAGTTHSYYPTSSSGGGYSDVPGVPSSFAACVALRESTNGAGSSNIYGIQGPGGQGSLAEQKQAFAQMYASRGSQPWSPYDGC